MQPTADFSCDGRAEGAYANPDDPHTFYRCINAYPGPVLEDCPTNLSAGRNLRPSRSVAWTSQSGSPSRRPRSRVRSNVMTFGPSGLPARCRMVVA
ncbi:chitin binding peritrophin-A domain-containing protein [Nocardia tengchongensis]|uniref:chitin binding peritrophin-A domain-containing protein n=1 Tax=Nocardia tengchongensis TaxID=2055889 RepID=UPI0036A8C31F